MYLYKPVLHYMVQEGQPSVRHGMVQLSIIHVPLDGNMNKYIAYSLTPYDTSVCVHAYIYTDIYNITIMLFTPNVFCMIMPGMGQVQVLLICSSTNGSSRNILQM